MRMMKLWYLIPVIVLSLPAHGGEVPFWRQLVEQRLEKIRAGKVSAPILHGQQIRSLDYAYYRFSGERKLADNDPLHVSLPSGDELKTYQTLYEQSDSEALAYLDELYGKRDDLKALALRDSDEDGLPDYRISDYFGKFMECDLDADGDGIRNLYDSHPYDRSEGGQDSNGDGIPDVAGTYTDINANKLPDHLDWALQNEDQAMAAIQLRLFDQHKVILVERNASFDLKLATAADDAINKVLKGYFGPTSVLPTLRTIAVEKTALLGKLLAAVVEDNTSAQVFSQSQSLTVYDVGRDVSYDIGLLGLLVHELGHNHHMSLDYADNDLPLENGRTDFPAPNFVQLVEPFGWVQQGYYNGEFSGALPIVPRFAYSETSEPLFHFRGQTPEQWDEWLLQTYDELGQLPDYLEQSPFRERAIVSDYSLTTPYEWYGDNLLAYLVVVLEQEMVAHLERVGRTDDVDTAKQKITEAIRQIWPGFYHRNIASAVVTYFNRVFPISPEDRRELAQRYLFPFIDS